MSRRISHVFDIVDFTAYVPELTLVQIAKSGHIRWEPKKRQKLTDMLSIDDLFKGRHFDREVIILCVRWYLRFKLSFRDLVEKMAERGVDLAHTTVMRWIQRDVPEFEKRWNRFACKAARSPCSQRNGTVKANKYRPFSASNPPERVGDS
jgi:hypothetical protein